MLSLLKHDFVISLPWFSFRFYTGSAWFVMLLYCLHPHPGPPQIPHGVHDLWCYCSHPPYRSTTYFTREVHDLWWYCLHPHPGSPQISHGKCRTRGGNPLSRRDLPSSERRTPSCHQISHQSFLLQIWIGGEFFQLVFDRNLLFCLGLAENSIWNLGGLYRMSFSSTVMGQTEFAHLGDVLFKFSRGQFFTRATPPSW